jgi:hypothetical protein
MKAKDRQVVTPAEIAADWEEAAAVACAAAAYAEDMARTFRASGDETDMGCAPGLMLGADIRRELAAQSLATANVYHRLTKPGRA